MNEKERETHRKEIIKYQKEMEELQKKVEMLRGYEMAAMNYTIPGAAQHLHTAKLERENLLLKKKLKVSKLNPLFVVKP